MGNELNKNAEGYSDPTASKALTHVTEDENYRRFEKLLHMIFDLCELSDFHVEERLVLRDLKTGKVWR